MGNHMVTKRAKSADLVFKAISDPTRRQILSMLRAEGMPVGGIASHFAMSRPAVSKHLRMLRTAGLVRTRPAGTERICELDARPLKAVNDWLGDYQAFWQDSLQSLKKFVEENP